MGMTAVIGVAAGDALHAASAEGAPGRPHAALKQEYLDAVVAQGAAPLVITPDAAAAAAAVTARIDGLLLVGGADVDPARYGETPLNDSVSPGPARDALELALLASVQTRGLPILSICRGHQLLNVSRGGTLWQDLPAQRPDALRHGQCGPPDADGHEVRVAPGSLLHRIVGAERLAANSFHHQSVRRLGRGLQASAWSADGMVEALEDPAQRFVLGVQWHPEELLARPPHRALFQAFVHEAERRTTG